MWAGPSRMVIAWVARSVPVDILVSATVIAPSLVLSASISHHTATAAALIAALVPTTYTKPSRRAWYVLKDIIVLMVVMSQWLVRRVSIVCRERWTAHHARLDRSRPYRVSQHVTLALLATRVQRLQQVGRL